MKLVPQGCPVPASTVALNLWVLGTRSNKKETNKKGVSSMERVMFTYPSLPNIFWIGAGGLQNTSWGSAQIPQQKQSFWGSWKTRTTTNIFLVLLPASKMSTTNNWKTFCLENPRIEHVLLFLQQLPNKKYCIMHICIRIYTGSQPPLRTWWLFLYVV